MEPSDKKKEHRKRLAGRKADKKKDKKKHEQELTPRQKNPKAFSIQSVNKTAKRVQRTLDHKTKKHHIPLVDRTPQEPPPVVVGIVGPPKVGKTTLLQCLVKNYAKQKLSQVSGPVTVVSGKDRRLTLIECNNDINSMIDVAKVADLVLLLVDASFGFEMETFEFLNICQVHGFPRIMGVLTHLDMFKDNKRIRKTKKRMKHRFWTEIYQGAKLFYLSGTINGEYSRTEVHNLCRFISVMKFRPLQWRITHPYVLADRMEDITNPENIRQNTKCDRNVCLYGYVRGTHLKNQQMVHIPGCGDFNIHHMQYLSDPCPTPSREKRRSLNEKERYIYAPMSGVGGIVYDKDAVYIDLGGSHSHTEKVEEKPSNELVSQLIEMIQPVDKKMTSSEMSVFTNTAPIRSADAESDEEGSGDDDDDNSDDDVEDEGNESDGECKTPSFPKERVLKTDDGRTRRRAIFQDEESEDEEEDRSTRAPNRRADVTFADSDDDLEQDFKLFKNKPKGAESASLQSPKIEDKVVKQKTKEKDVWIDFDADSDEDIDPKKSENDSHQKNPDLDSDDDDEDSDEGSDDSCDINQHSSMQNKSILQTSQKSKTVCANASTSAEKNSKTTKLKVHTPVTTEKGVTGKKSKGELDQEEKEKDTSKSGKIKQKSVNGLEFLEPEFDEMSIDSDEEEEEEEEEGNDDDSSSDDEEESEEEDESDEDSDDELKIISNLSEKAGLESDKSVKDSSRVGLSGKKKRKAVKEDEESSADEEGEEAKKQSAEEEGLQWKSDLAVKASEAFKRRQQQKVNYQKLVYGQDAELDSSGEEDGEGELGGLFKVLRQKKEYSRVGKSHINDMDCSRRRGGDLHDWDMEEVQQLIRDCFVTGTWDKSEDAAARLKEDDEMYGDFEDLETGEVHKGEISDKQDEEDEKEESGEKKDSEPEEERKKTKAEMTAAERRIEKKRKLKEMFDQEYDMKGDEEFYDTWKAELEKQAQLNRAEFDALGDEQRVQFEGFRPGMYVRVEINNMPCEFVENFDPTFPVILGGLQNVEVNVGYVQARIKRHRWYKKILKTRNPLIVSLGWRRFQTLPLFSVQDHNFRNRLLKYTPEHIHCNASFWGPLTPQGTGLLAVESVSEVTSKFRIAATGVVLELDKSMEIVKKLKLIGTPNKIFKKTAFIEGMFNSNLEVAKFEGASIRTVSGIRGQIKKGLKTPEGAFRATFEDKILMSDMVFVRTWYQVEVPQFYNPVTTLLLPKANKAKWQGMKTVGQLRHERGLSAPQTQDSRYTRVERMPKRLKPLMIPRELQQRLPFKDTPKELLTAPDPVKRVSVIREPKEAKVAKVMKMMKALYEHKRRSTHIQMRQRAEKHQQKMEKMDAVQNEKQKKIKKDVYRILGKIDGKKKKKKTAPE